MDMAESPFWAELEAFCLSFDKVEVAHPWADHTDFRIKGKTFVFTSGDRPTITISAKPLPDNRQMFLQLPGVSVAAYVGRFGWLTAQITDQASLDMAKDMIAESYQSMTAKKTAKSKGPGK
ncbi:MAG: DifB protein [Symbiobacteriaceae bacterium]|jgi:predicted DNA-binding protein (MmcQ/YjbR family)|nr:DifB protein [Symbiobacteriaceae bacterium]